MKSVLLLRSLLEDFGLLTTLRTVCVSSLEPPLSFWPMY